MAKYRSADVCAEIRQLDSDHVTFLSRVITGDLSPCDFFFFPKMKLKLKGHQCDTVEEIQAESQRVPDRKLSKNGGDGGTGVYMRGATSRVTAAHRPFGEFYDFYSVSLEYFNTTSYFVRIYHTDKIG
jgi:hypothetical protein